MGKILSLAAAILTAVALALVPTLPAESQTLPPFTSADVPPAPDYAAPSGWLAMPEDPEAFAVDVVWIYPTVLDDHAHWLMDAADKEMVAPAMMTVTTEATIFSRQANLYAPFYRQMNFAAYELHDAQRAPIEAPGMDDINRAMDYYFTHINKRRPFILAGYSQGSELLTEYLFGQWANVDADVKSRMIASYALGWSITEDDLKAHPTITICDAAKQTGCVITFNSVAAGQQNIAPTIFPGAVVVNPLTWTRDGALAPASLNSGATFFNADGSSQTLPGFTSAQIVDGGLVVTPKNPKLAHTPGFPPGVYHGYDYLLFYQNMQANLAQRIEQYLSQPQ